MKAQVQTIIFACVHNAGRSQMAAAFFNKYADGQKVRAISAGTEPANQVHPEVLEVMKEKGIDLSKAMPTFLSLELVQTADLLITMGCGEKCPFVAGLRILDWQLDDPKGQSLDVVRSTRDKIEKLVLNLIQENSWQKNIFHFENLNETHISKLRSWLKEPHVAEFWQEPEDETEFKKKFLIELKARGVSPYVIFYDAKPIGYIQSYEAILVGGGWWPDAKAGTFGIDQFIGESEFVNKGFGTKLIRQFIEKLFENSNVSEVITDPAPQNSRAIRAYEKVGFKKIGSIKTPSGEAMLLSIGREEFLRSRLPIFKTSRLILKEVTPSDVPAYEKHFIDYEVISHLSATVPWPYPPNGVTQFLQNNIFPTQGKSQWLWGVFEKENPEVLIGVVHLWREGRPEHRGFWLGKPFWGKGYMTEAVSPVMDYAFNELGFEKLVFSNAVGNEKSRRVKVKTGARLIDVKPAQFVNPNYTEHEIWELTKQEWLKYKNKV